MIIIFAIISALKIETRIEYSYCSESKSYAAAYALLQWG